MAKIAKENKWFDTVHLNKNLKSRSVKGGVSTVAGQVGSFILSTSSTVIMARLLLPEDYGLIAMVSSIIGFVTIFKDLGLSSAVIQKDKLTQTEVSSVFWTNIIISLCIALIIALIAPIIAYFYHESRLLKITLLLALDIFIVGLALQHHALLKRQMRFNALTSLQLATVTLSLLSSILFAWLGFGYWALVIQSFVLSISQTIALWLLCDWRPDFIFSKSSVKFFLKFGAGITGFDVVNHFSRNMDNVFIGKFVGSVALGLYSKAYQLLMLPITQLRNPLNAVALPVLSSLKDNENRYRSFYSQYLFVLAFFSMPIIIYLVVFANEIIEIILGKQWVQAAPLFQLLGVVAFIQPVLSTTGLILITTGRVNRYFKIGLIGAVFNVSGFGIGVLLDGVRGVIFAQIIVFYGLLFPTLFYNLHKTPISVNNFVGEVVAPLIFSLLSGLAMAAYSYYTNTIWHIQIPNIAYCSVGFLIGTIVYLGCMLAFPCSRTRFVRLIEMRNSFKPK